MRLSMYHSGYENEFLYFFGNDIIGSYIISAHGFMFAMGVGMTYSRKGEPSDLIKRGIKIWVLGYVLNFFRYGIYFVIYDIIKGKFAEETLDAIFLPDILQFAGIALIATGILKRLRFQAKYIVAIGLALSVIGTAASFFETGNYVIDLLLGNFVFTTLQSSVFSFFSWYIFVAVGLSSGNIGQGWAV